VTFLSVLALAVAALVAAPYVAHRLRRKRAEERPFAAARLVPPTPPRARARAQLEDRWLFGIRAASIVALAVLGASPLVRCSRLALSRGGASVAVAIVLDDSMSMRVKTGAGTRFTRAKDGAREILASLREGDAAAIVLAGAPARVGLAATTDIGAAKAALEGLGETDRATDLDGAIAIAKTLVGGLPQVDRRIVVLSDLADGKADAPPLGENAGLPVWLAIPELRAAGAEDCGIVAADRAGGRARVRFACSSLAAASGRDVQIRDGDKTIATSPLPQTQLGEASVAVSYDEGKDLTAALTGGDAIPSDDHAPLVVESGPAALAVVGDRADESVATGGAPVVEQALGALHVDMAVRPIPQAPDRREDTAPFAAIVVDDPPGFTPEQRRALGAFVDRGGLLFVALGRRAAAAPLGASFEPFLGHAVGWSESTSASGADVASGAAFFGEAASSLADLAPKGRAKLADDDASSFEPLVKWTDGAALVARRARGRGEVWISTLPFTIDVSDFALRPGFLAMLDAFVAEARQRAVPRRGDVGVPWTFAGAQKLEVQGPGGAALAPSREDGVLRVVPAIAGAYRIAVDGAKETRVAAPIAREIDLRPRAVAESATSSKLGAGVAVVDVSWVVALVLLGLVAAELVARALGKPRREPPATPDPRGA
jgi:hypothetical protein